MYRVAKRISSGEYIEDIITTELVGKKPNCGLVILHTDPDRIMKCLPGQRIHEFLLEHKIDIDLSCSSSPVTLEDVKKAISNDARTTMRDLHDVIEIIKNKCPGVFYLGVGIIVDTISSSISYTVCTGGRLFPNTCKMLNSLGELGVDSYIASGDSMRNLEKLATIIKVPLERIYDVATPKKKEWVIKHLKTQYDQVVMVGDSINDILAFRASDRSVLSVQQTGVYSERLCIEADIVIKDILQIVDIVKEMLSQQP